jgi:hypothetical protein
MVGKIRTNSMSQNPKQRLIAFIDRLGYIEREVTYIDDPVTLKVAGQLVESTLDVITQRKKELESVSE